jgi:putative membrane protein
VKIFAMIRAELARLTATTMSRVALVALMLVPVLYGGLYLWANQDPYAGLDRVPVALVNTDTGGELDGTITNYGADVAEQLIDDGTFDWHTVTAGTASAGVADATYDFSVTIPADFSSSIASSSSDTPHQATITLTTNDTNSYLASTIGSQAAQSIREAIVARVNEQAANTLLIGLSDIRSSLVDAADGAGTLTDGATTAADGGSSLADGAGTLADGTGELADGAGALADGTGTLADGAGRVADGSGQVASGASALADGTGTLAAGAGALADGTGTLAAGAGSLSDGTAQVAEGAGALAAGTGKLSDGAAALATGAGQVASGATALSGAATALADGTAQVSTGAADLAAGTGTLSTGAAQVAAAAQQVADGNAQLATAAAGAGSVLTGASGALDTAKTNLSESLRAAGLTDEQVAGILAGFAPLDTAVADATTTFATASDGIGVLAEGSAALATGAADLADGAASAATGAGTVATGAAAAADGAATAATGAAALAEGAGSTASGASTLAGSLATAADGTRTLAAGAGSAATGAASLAAGAGQTATGAADLASGAADAGTGASTLAAGAGQTAQGAASLSAGAASAAAGAATLSAGADSAKTGAETLATGASSLSDGLVGLRDGAGTLRDGLSDGASSIPDTDAATIDLQGSTIADPVDLTTAAVTSAGTYGAGLAPFFASLAGWIGIYALFLIVKPVSRRAITALHSPLKITLAGWLTPGILGLLQMAALFGILTGVLHFEVHNPLGTYAMMGLAALTFAAIILALNVWLGSVGQFVGLVLMVLQLVTAGGTFPWQTLPAPLAFLHHVVPMSYAVDGIRQLMYGGNPATALNDAGVLLLWLTGALALAAIGVVRMTHFRTLRDLKPSLIG